MMLGINFIEQHNIKWWSDNDMMMLGRNIIANGDFDDDDVREKQGRT